MSFPTLVPSAFIVSSSVVHAVGADTLTNGGRLTRRGAGAPVWPPGLVETHRSGPLYAVLIGVKKTWEMSALTVQIRQLEAALVGFEGTLLLVSHDRRLLEAVRTIRALTPEGAIAAAQ